MLSDGAPTYAQNVNKFHNNLVAVETIFLYIKINAALFRDPSELPYFSENMDRNDFHSQQVAIHSKNYY
jgi:hypothetical protein